MRIRHLSLFAVAALLGGCGGHDTGGQLPPQAALPAAIAEMAGPQYAVAGLSTLGGTAGGGSSINGLGWVAGAAATKGNASQHAALWKGTTATDLGTLGGSNSAVEWPVHNDHGLVAGISETSTTDPLGEAWSCAAFIATDGHTCLGFAWSAGTMTALATLGGNNGYAAGANNAGQIVGWAETSKHDSTCVKPAVLAFKPVVWAAGKHAVTALPTLPGDPDGAATATNDRGQVVGISGICDQDVGRFTARHAVIWNDGTPTKLPMLGGVAWNTPTSIDDRGDVVGFADLPGDKSGTPNFHAFLWTRSGGTRDLGTLPGDAYSEALGINDRGVIVGVSYAAGFASSRAFIWQHGKMRDLNALLGSKPSFALLYANDVNDKGEITGGACELNKAGKCTKKSRLPAFRATPVSGN